MKTITRLLCWRNLRCLWRRRCLSTGSLLMTFVLLLHLKMSTDGSFNRLLVPGDQTRHSLLGPQTNSPALLLRKLLSSVGHVPDNSVLLDLDQKLEPQNWTCLNTSTVPSVPICIHDPSEDRFVSAQLASGGAWEPNTTKLFQRALDSYPEALVMDLGAHIGYYTLLAAGMGHRVVAVEPMRESVVRLQRAAQLANTTRLIAVIPRAISDIYELVTFRYKKGNKGGTSVRPVTPSEIGDILKNNKYGVVNTVIMNDLSTFFNSTRSSTVVIKIDIEGYECKALASSETFFNIHYIPYIFMEWETMFRNRHRYGAPCRPAQLQGLTEVLARRGYQPYAVKRGSLLQLKQGSTNLRTGDILWRHKNAPHLPIVR